MDPEYWRAIYEMFHRLSRRWVPPAIPRNDVWHAYDPLPLADFIDGIETATPHVRGRRFLDLGCGIGTKLAFMFAIGWEVAGVERDPDYATSAADLVPEAKIIHRNILDCESFDADLIYLYRPAREEDLEIEVERHVAERVSPGAILFLPGRPRCADLESVGHECWRAA